MAELNVIKLSEIEEEEVRWLWPGRIPLGKLTHLSGDPGNFKTTIALDIAARVTAGRPMPDGAEAELDGPSNVMFIGMEDGPGDTIHPRFGAAGGVFERFDFLRDVTEEGKERFFNLQQHGGELLDYVVAHDIVLLIIDPLSAYLGRANTHRDSDVRNALRPLLDLTAKSGAAALCIRHLNKNEDVKNPIYRGIGSIAFTGLARSEMLVASNPDASGKVLLTVKHNLVPEQPAMAYRGDEDEKGNVRIAWEGSEAVDAAEALGSERRGRTERAKAADFLRAYLADRDGAVPSAAVKEAAERIVGVSESVLNKASQGIVYKHKNGTGGPWEWSLLSVENDSQRDQGA